MNFKASPTQSVTNGRITRIFIVSFALSFWSLSSLPARNVGGEFGPNFTPRDVSIWFTSGGAGDVGGCVGTCEGVPV